MPLLTVDHVSKQFGAITAVNDVSFQIEAGRCVALLGPNGAGKTTTLKLLSGLIRPTEGRIQFADEDKQDTRSLIGYLPQFPSFYKWMTGLEFLQFVGRLAQIPQSQVKKRGMELLALVGLEDARNRRIAGYSGGMKQRLGIAQALMHHPRLLIMDEPVSALDPVGRREILEMLRVIKANMTILFSTHVLHDAEEISDDVLIMHQGAIAIHGPLDQLREQYSQSRIEIIAEHSLHNVISRWRGYDFIEQILQPQGDPAQALIYVRDLKKAQSVLLHELSEEQVILQKFAVSRPSLEDVFMKVVQR